MKTLYKSTAITLVITILWQFFPTPAFAALPLTTALPQSGSIVSRWKLNEASGNAVDSVGSNTLTDNNTVATLAGQFDEDARDFESLNSQAFSLLDPPSLDFATGVVTFSVWVNLESQPGTNLDFRIGGKYLTTGSQRGYFFGYADDAGVLQLLMDTSSDCAANDDARVTQTLSNSVWYFLTFKSDGAGTATAYVNGSPIGTGTVTSDFCENTSDFYIGTIGNQIRYFDGLMQDATIWSVALSDADVLSAYNAYFPAAATSTPASPPLWFGNNFPMKGEDFYSLA